MYFWQSFKTWFINNKEDVLAVFVISFIITAILCSYTFNTVAPQEGWYSIYARNILQDGLVPYRDFFLVVPPIFLYIWTIWQAIFGDNFIVFHYLNFLFQISCVTSFYLLFKQVFNRKIAIIVSLLITILKMFSEWDNGLASYNTLALIFMALMALFTIKQVHFINIYKKISKKWLWWLGFIFAISFLNKQTSGTFTIIASCMILMAITYRVLGIRQALKHFIHLFLVSVFFVALFLLPLLITGALPAMIANIFNATSKGTPLILFIKLFVLPFRMDLWTYYIMTVILCLIFLPKLQLIDWKNSNDNNFIKKFFPTLILIFIIVFLAVNNLPQSSYLLFNKLHVHCNNFLYISYHVSLFFTVILFFYLLLIYFRGKVSHKIVNLLIIVLFFLLENIAELLSNGFHYPQFVSLLTGLLLLGKWKNFDSVKNVIIILIIAIFFFVSFAYKLYNPMKFWGWQSGSVLGKLETSFIPRLKGIKIPIEEKQMYEEIYSIVHKYTNEDDKILAFNNNQIFYDLTDRRPYTRYISLYHDVSPDNQPLEILNTMQSNLPKVIIFLRFSDEIEQFHEDLYRGHTSGQRELRNYIDSLIKEGEYFPVKTYKQKRVVNISKLPVNLLNEYRAGELSQSAKIELLNKISSFAAIKNSFIQQDCVLYLLIRRDLV